MKRLFGNLLSAFLLLVCLNQQANDSEFIIPKNNRKNTVSSSKLRQSIVNNYAEVLKIDLKLNKFSNELRSFILDEMEEYFQADDNFLTLANKEQLKKSLEELVLLKDSLEKNISDFTKKLSNVKSKFKLNQKKS